jgi:hypothetical protein
MNEVDMTQCITPVSVPVEVHGEKKMNTDIQAHDYEA